MFGTDTFDQMPASFLTDPTVWDAFIGQVWQAVLAPLCLPANATVIEIAPGSAAKVGHALAATGFSGDLHIIEPSTPARQKIADRYRRLLPDARLHLYDVTLAQALPHLPRHAQALLGNHVIDDFLLGACAQETLAFHWASQYSDTVAPQTRAAFDALQGNSAIADIVRKELSGTMDALAPQHCVLSQYPSATLLDNGMDSLNRQALAVLQQLQADIAPSYALNDCTAALAALPHYNNAHIGLHVLNPRHWMSCTRKS